MNNRTLIPNTVKLLTGASLLALTTTFTPVMMHPAGRSFRVYQCRCRGNSAE